jgi:hypothetical protein
MDSFAWEYLDRQHDAKLPVSRSAYVISYSSVGNDYEVRIEETDLNKALIKFATTYHSIDAVHSITKAE